MYLAVCRVSDSPKTYMFSAFHDESIGAEGDIAKQLYNSRNDPKLAFDARRTTVYGAETKSALRELVALDLLR